LNFKHRKQRFFVFTQNRMRLSIVQKRFWLCIRLSLFFSAIAEGFSMMR